MNENTTASSLVTTHELFSMRSFALHYAEQGLDVLRLKPRGKAPMTQHGFYDATTDRETIDYWWATCPDANVGVRPRQGIVVLDVDFHNDGSLDELDPITQTLTMRSGSGGVHLWYRLPREGRVRSALAGARGIDIKSHNGYLVMPPSIHPSGQRYDVLIEHEIAFLPDHLVDRVYRAPATAPRARSVEALTGHWRGSSAALVRKVLTATEGERNSTLYWATCRAYEENSGPSVFDALADAADRAGLQAEEVVATMDSARHAPPREDVVR